MYGGGGNAVFDEKRRHEIGMPLRDTERNCATTGAPAILIKCIRSTRLGCNGLSEFILVELPVPPRDVTVVDGIRDSVIAKRTEELATYSLSQVATIDQVIIAEREQVGSVRS